MDDFLLIEKFIEKESGIMFGESNRFQLKTRVESFLKDENIDNISLLIKKLNEFGNKDLKSRFIDRSTNNETSFFRDSNFFKGLEQLFIEKIMPYQKNIKIWSAASSSGQEAVSVAILLEELKIRYDFEYSILGSDISFQILNKAKSSTYSEFELGRGLSSELRNKYFIKNDKEWIVSDLVRKKINFIHNNLLAPYVFEQFDLILCRNVLIYHSSENKKKILNYLLSNLNPSGFIAFGVGETLLGLNDSLEKEMYHNSVFYKK